MAKVLTSRFVESVKSSGQGRAEYPDGALPGFRLRVTAGGHKSFSLRYRSPLDLSHKRLSWAWPAFSLAEARTEAEAALRSIERGEEPSTTKAQAKEIAFERGNGTVDALCDRYIDEYLKKNVRRWSAAEGEINNHIRPGVGQLLAKELQRADVRRLIATIKPDAPVAANRALQRLRAIFNWALEQDLVETNPTLGIKRPTRERPVSRTLSDDELGSVWRACDALQYPASHYFRFVILTGQRRDDVRMMHWSEIDIKRADWVISQERYKNRRSHLVPMTDRVVATLKNIPFASSGGYVFSVTAGETAYGNVIKPKRKLDAISGVYDWTIHDLRRTLRTGLSRLGVRPDISERVIGHTVGGSLGQVYDTHEFRDEKRVALELWDAHVMEISR